MTITELPTHDDQSTTDVGRWRPTRAGLINIWQYEEETFEFEHGRLVLFGTNGSGKTMALELLFPYLLDANASPARLSTAGGNERGGLWSRVAGYDDSASRVGYLWAEFSRTGDDGAIEHFTCGSRLQARAGSKGKQAWFTTTRRVGRDLHLLGSDRTPIDTKELKDAIDGHGTVWGPDASGYRNAVRAVLYSEFRSDEYQALIEGLLAVRKQSITDGLTPGRLDQLLTDGLPGLDPGELDQVARGFERLDARRDTIMALDNAVAVSRTLTRRNRGYARTAMRLLARAVTTSHSRFDDVRRREAAAAATLETTTDAKRQAEQRLKGLEDELTGLGGRRDAILASPQYGSLDQLESRRTQAETAEGRAAEADESRDRSERRAATSENEAAEAESAAASLDETVGTAVGTLRSSGRRGGIDIDIDADPVVTAERFRDAATSRAAAVSAVGTQLDEHGNAIRERDRATRDEDDRSNDLDERRRNVTDAHAALDETTQQWRDELTAWRAGLTELAPASDLDTATAAANLDAAGLLIGAAHSAAVVELGRLDARLDGDETDLETEIAALTSERDQLASADGTLPPEPAPWRNTRDGTRPGSALWSLLDAADGTDSDVLDGIEAALDGAGLLDAWIGTDGTIDIVGDITAVPTAPAPGHTLLDLLTVDVAAARDAGVDPDIVEGVLRSVPVADDVIGGDAAFVVDGNGTFRSGPVIGHVPHRPARHIGAVARERARQERIAELDAQIAARNDNLDAVRRNRETLARRVEVADSERDNAPHSRPVIDARNASDRAEDRAADAEERLEVAVTRRVAAERDVQDAFLALNRIAAQHSLPTDRTELGKVTEALRYVERHASDVVNAATDARSAHRESAKARKLADERRNDADRDHQAAEQAGTAALAARSMFDQLEQSVGEDAKQAAEQLEHVNASIAASTEARKATISQIRTLDGDEGRARGILEETSGLRANAETVRERAVDRFRRAIDAGLGSDAELEVTIDDVPNLTAAVAAAGTVREATTGNPTAATLSRDLQALEDERFRAQAVLGGRADLTITVIEDAASESDDETADELHVVVSVAAAAVDGTPVPFHTMLERFENERDRARNELADEEARLFEETLTGSLRTHLASRLRAAQALVDGMNDLLSRIRSASGGVAVSLRWDVDDDIDDQATLTQAKTLLLKSHHTSDERDMLFGFLTRRIEAVRSDDQSTASWREALEALFDYRRWHTFRIMVRHDRFGERAVPFTSRKVSLSAGEKALVMSLPLFAAIAAHYMPRDEGGPAPRCPRFLLLDEVFPKNDRANKRQILGLLTDLDLDCVLTSDKDMCDYDTVDAIAIAVIAKDGDRSYATRLVWNGNQLVDAPITDTGRPGTTPTLL